MFNKPRPVDSLINLRERVERTLVVPQGVDLSSKQLSLDLSYHSEPVHRYTKSSKNVYEFFNFLSDALPDGDLYLYGGVLRDLALFGKRGFNSDIDVVVEGNWQNCAKYIESFGAKENKFGGLRLVIDGWPIDIWHAPETWAVKKGLVDYKGISSLTETTILNWDAILMNWRTKNFVCKTNYLEELRSRTLNVLLTENPNPLGMAVRVFRHLCIKDAKKITISAAKYLASCTQRYSFQELKDAELKSYGNSVLETAVYGYFKYTCQFPEADMRERFQRATEEFQKRGITVTLKQCEWDFELSH